MADYLLLLDIMAKVEAALQPLATCLTFLRGWLTPELEGSQSTGGLFFLLGAERTGHELVQCLSGRTFCHGHQFERTLTQLWGLPFPRWASSVEDISMTTEEWPEEGGPCSLDSLCEAPRPPNPGQVT